MGVNSTMIMTYPPTHQPTNPPTHPPTHPATLVNFLLLDCHLLSSLSHQDLPSFRLFLEKKKLDNNLEENKEKQIFFRQLCSNSLPCSVSQASKGR